MKTGKEKSQKLIKSYLNASFNCKECNFPYCDTPCTRLNVNEAKQCALICIDEMIEIAKKWENTYMGKEEVVYLKQVKQEIQKL
jgi:hypothetical protein